MQRDFCAEEDNDRTGLLVWNGVLDSKPEDPQKLTWNDIVVANSRRVAMEKLVEECEDESIIFH